MDIKKSLYFIIIFLNIASGIEVDYSVYIKSSSDASCYNQKNCLTLSQFAAANVSWLRKDNNITMLLLPSPTANHTLNLKLNISNIAKFSMLVNDRSKSFIICQENATLDFTGIDQVWLRGVWFIRCGLNLFQSVKLVKIEDCTFQGQGDSGTAMVLYNSNAIVSKTYFISNTRGLCFIWLNELPTIQRVYGGGAVVVNQSNAIFLNCKFERNMAEAGGAINVVSAYIDIIGCDFVHNYVTTIKRGLQCPGPAIKNYQRKGGAINALHSTLFINNSIFYNNTNWYGAGGAINIIESNVMASNNQFVNNRAVLGFGGVLFLSVAYVEIHNSTFYNSCSYQGGVAVLLQSYLSAKISIFRNNEAKVIDVEDFRAEGGVIIGDHSQMKLAGCQFRNNKARFGGVLVAQRSMVTLEDSIVSGNVGGDGGVLNVIQTHIVSMGRCSLINNTGYTAGGAVQLSGGCTLDVYDTLIIGYNRAKSGGGGVALHQSRLNCHYNCTLTFLRNKAGKCGGGIRAFNAIITIYVNRTSIYKSSIKFIENSSTRGGGICLELGAKIVIRKIGSVEINETFHLYYISNSADIGQAIFVNDETNYEMCDWRHPLGADCFLQVLSINYFASAMVTIQFKQNKSIIFGGLLDRCTLDEKVEFIESDIKPPKTVAMDGVTYLKIISTLNSTKGISSKPVKLCFCREDGIPDCSYQPYSLKDPVRVKKGQVFNVSLVAVDQVNHTIPNIMIYSSLNQKGSGLGEGQLTQITSNACTNLAFNIYSPQSSEHLILYPEGPCRNATLSQGRIYVTFLPCTCPIGFQSKDLYLDANSTSCTCVCDSKLQAYVTDPDCNPQTETLTRKANFWITHMEYSNSTGYLVYPHCPFDYCFPPSSNVHINLNLKHGSDEQCSNNRSGLLCGVCRPNFSLSLGSSRCIPCRAVWQKHLILILLVSLVSGIVLVALIMVLNLTVAIGTLNGLILYANLIHANNSGIFFSSPSAKVFFIFLSWLNLDVGFDFCFFEGLNSYWKTWLHLTFPLYIIFLIIMIMLLSERSVTLSRLIARRNPLAALATLILLSYTKVLRTIIAALSFAHLDYPDGSHKLVWLPDATVGYLSGKHTPLLIVGLLILVVGTLYTAILFFWQWFLYYQHKLIFRWVRNQKLYQFLEPYHAPFILKHRYFTGLLLFARVILYIAFALNVSGDPGVNLLSIIVIMSAILLLKGYHGQLYKNKAIDAIEMLHYLNILIFSATKLYNLEAKDAQTNSDFVSGSTMFALFLIILTYHIFTELHIVKLFCFKFWTCLQQKRLSCRSRNEEALTNYPPVDSDLTDPAEPTKSTIESPSYDGEPLSALMRLEDQGHMRLSQIPSLIGKSSQDNTSMITTSLSVPLLEKERQE